MATHAPITGAPTRAPATDRCALDPEVVDMLLNMHARLDGKHRCQHGDDKARFAWAMHLAVEHQLAKMGVTMAGGMGHA